MMTRYLQLYRNLIHLRRTNPTLVEGRLSAIKAEGANLEFERSGDGTGFRIALNMGSDPVRTDLEDGTVAACTDFDREGQRVSGNYQMRAAEGLIIALESYNQLRGSLSPILQ